MSCVTRLALAPVGTGQIDTGPTVLAQAWRGTFIHIYLTLLASVASQAGAGELISRHSACTPIGTRLRCTGINPLAFLSCETWKTDTLVRVLAVGVTSASIQAGLGHVAKVRFRVLTFLPRESRSTLAGRFSYQGCSFTSSPILTGIAFTGVSVLTVVSKKAFSTLAISCTILIWNALSLINTWLGIIHTLQSGGGLGAAEHGQHQGEERGERGPRSAGHGHEIGRAHV